MIKLDLFVTAV